MKYGKTIALLGVSLSLLSVSAVIARPLPEIKSAAGLDELAGDRAASVRAYRVTLEGALFRTQKDGSRNPMPLELVIVNKGKAWDTFVGAAAPGFNQGAHTATLRDPKAGMSALSIDANIGKDRWVKGDPKASYTLSLAVSSKTVSGTFTGVFQGTPVKGNVSGIVVFPGWMNAETDGDAVNMSFDLGDRRVNWNNARWAVYNFMAATDLRRFDGVKVTVEVEQPRSDATVSFGVMEEDGSWYYIRDAAPMTRKSSTVVIDFAHLRHAEFIFNGAGTGPGVEGNFDEDFHFDFSRTFRLAFGVINPLGVGEVSFRVRDIEFVSWKDRSNEPVEVNVTGKTIAINGQREVPGGIFGFHAAGGRASQVSDLNVGSLRHGAAQGYGGSSLHGPSPQHGVDLAVTFNYDRRQQLLQVVKPNWEEVARSIGRQLGQKAKPHGDTVAMEWWNEPYLDMARNIGREVAKRAKKDGVKDGDPVTLDGRRLESMVWREVPTKDKQGNVTGSRMEIVDPSRFTYWSGRQVSIFYSESFNVVVDEAKKIAPKMQAVGGFGFRWNEDEWAGWEVLYKHMVDTCIDRLDGVCEHHYQGYTDAMPATYEVLQAYTDAVHGKRVPVYNTETNDLWDAPARGNARAATQFGGKFKSRRRLVYNLRDILGCIKDTPDKIKARAIHALWSSRGGDTPWAKAGIDEGEWYALKFLRDLRGKLVLVESGDPQVWAVASIEPKSNSMVVVFFNDGPRTRTVRPHLTAPAGTGFHSSKLVTLTHDAEGAIELIENKPEDIRGMDKMHAAPIAIEPSCAVKLVIQLKGKVAPQPVVRREQVFGGHWAKNRQPIINRVMPNGIVELPFDLPKDATSVSRAWIRVVLENCGEGEGFVMLGDRKLVLPTALTPMNGPYIREIPIDPAWLAGVKTLRFSAPGPEAGNGYLLGMASIVLERE